jgi:hypothetical protein
MPAPLSFALPRRADDDACSPLLPCYARPQPLMPDISLSAERHCRRCRRRHISMLAADCFSPLFSFRRFRYLFSLAGFHFRLPRFLSFAAAPSLIFTPLITADCLQLAHFRRRFSRRHAPADSAFDYNSRATLPRHIATFRADAAVFTRLRRRLPPIFT